MCNFSHSPRQQTIRLFYQWRDLSTFSRSSMNEWSREGWKKSIFSESIDSINFFSFIVHVRCCCRIITVSLLNIDRIHVFLLSIKKQTKNRKFPHSLFVVGFLVHRSIDFSHKFTALILCFTASRRWRIKSIHFGCARIDWVRKNKHWMKLVARDCVRCDENYTFRWLKPI